MITTSMRSGVMVPHARSGAPLWEAPPRRPRWGWMLFLLCLGGLLIWCHGCHGEDHDDELFDRGVEIQGLGR